MKHMFPVALLTFALLVPGTMLSFGCDSEHTTPEATASEIATPKAIPADSASGVVTAHGNSMPIKTALALWMPRNNTLRIELYTAPLDEEGRRSVHDDPKVRNRLLKADPPPEGDWGPAAPNAAFLIRFHGINTAFSREDIRDVRLDLKNFRPGDQPSSEVFYLTGIEDIFAHMNVAELDQNGRVTCSLEAAGDGGQDYEVDVEVDTRIVATL
ncbi:MAG: hypothetical protein ACLFTT_09370 [Candidatus Hydrogenedentota bacterium]